jgi:hypothetical protein
MRPRSQRAAPDLFDGHFAFASAATANRIDENQPFVELGVGARGLWHGSRFKEV